MQTPTARCEQCNRTRAEMKCHLDIYNEDDEGCGGNLICDDCVYAAAEACDKRTNVVMPVRPEGYYHAPIGTFD